MNAAAEMQACEEALLHTDFSSDPATLEDWLTADFTEVASSGVVSNRELVVDWLLRKDTQARWQLTELTASDVASGVRLVRYRAKQVAPQASASKGALHCSLWCFNAALQRWQLRFHQATKLV